MSFLGSKIDVPMIGLWIVLVGRWGMIYLHSFRMTRVWDLFFLDLLFIDFILFWIGKGER